MRAGIASVVLALSLTAVPLAGTATDAIRVIDFEDATEGFGNLIGVDQTQTPSQNLGFEGFFWAWNGGGVVVPGGPASAGFVLGNRADFEYEGGDSPEKFAYVGARETKAYITAMDVSFDFLSAYFWSTTPGTLAILGQKRNANGAGNGAYSDVLGAETTVVFDGQPNAVELNTASEFRNIDRLVISSISTSGTSTPFQWALDDFAYAPVPEASTWAMFGLGVLGVGFAVKRRKPRIR